MPTKVSTRTRPCSDSHSDNPEQSYSSGTYYIVQGYVTDPVGMRTPESYKTGQQWVVPSRDDTRRSCAITHNTVICLPTKKDGTTSILVHVVYSLLSGYNRNSNTTTVCTTFETYYSRTDVREGNHGSKPTLRVCSKICFRGKHTQQGFRET